MRPLDPYRNRRRDPAVRSSRFDRIDRARRFRARKGIGRRLTARLRPRQVFGSPEALEELLGESSARRRVNPSFEERQNATDRGRNARKAKKTYRFSKDWQVHEAMTYLTMYGRSFCCRVRTLGLKDGRRRWRERSPALAAGLADHVWTWHEWSSRPAVQPS